MKYLMLVLPTYLLTLSGYAQNAEIYGTIIDKAISPLEGVKVQVIKNGILKRAAISESDGSYSIRPLKEGNYNIIYSFKGYKNIRLTKVVIQKDQSFKIAVQKMEADFLGTGDTIVKEYKKVILLKQYINRYVIERAPQQFYYQDGCWGIDQFIKKNKKNLEINLHTIEGRSLPYGIFYQDQLIPCINYKRSRIPKMQLKDDHIYCEQQFRFLPLNIYLNNLPELRQL